MNSKVLITDMILEASCPDRYGQLLVQHLKEICQTFENAKDTLLRKIFTGWLNWESTLAFEFNCLT